MESQKIGFKCYNMKDYDFLVAHGVSAKLIICHCVEALLRLRFGASKGVVPKAKAKQSAAKAEAKVPAKPPVKKKAAEKASASGLKRKRGGD